MHGIRSGMSRRALSVELVLNERCKCGDLKKEAQLVKEMRICLVVDAVTRAASTRLTQVKSSEDGKT